MSVAVGEKFLCNDAESAQQAIELRIRKTFTPCGANVVTM